MNIFQEGMEKMHDMFAQVKAKLEGADLEAVEAIHQWITSAGDEMHKLRLAIETIQQRLSVRFAEFGEIPEVYENEMHHVLGITDDELEAAGIGADKSGADQGDQGSQETPPVPSATADTPETETADQGDQGSQETPPAPSATADTPETPDAPDATASAVPATDTPDAPPAPSAETPDTPESETANPANPVNPSEGAQQ